MALLPNAGWTAACPSDSAKLGTSNAVFHERSLKLKDMKGLLLFTPGVLQTRSAHGEELGAIGMMRAVKGAAPDSAQGIITAVAEAIESFRRSLAQMHDLTLLALSVR